MSREIEQVAAFRVQGPTVRTSNAREFDPAQARIGALWAQFLQAPPPLPWLAVYHDYASDHHGDYSLCLGARDAAAPTGVQVPAGRYEVFEAQGAMPQALIEAWQQVWARFDTAGAPRRAYRADFELHQSATHAQVFIGLDEGEPR